MVQWDADNKFRAYPAEPQTDERGHITGAKPLPDASPIKLFLESAPDREIGPPEPLIQPQFLLVCIGMPHGQHSGDENCFMRYNVADVYPKGPPGEYFWVRWDSVDRLIRTKICTTTVGHDVNLPRRKPRSRYEDADILSKRGACAMQICVNDGVAIERRDTRNQAPRGGIR